MARYGRDFTERRGSAAYGRGYDMDMGGSRWMGARGAQQDWGGARDFGTGGSRRNYGNPGWQGQNWGNPDWGGPRRFGTSGRGMGGGAPMRGYDQDFGGSLRQGWNQLKRGVRRAFDDGRG